jgi:hypothetical protein
LIFFKHVCSKKATHGEQEQQDTERRETEDFELPDDLNLGKKNMVFVTYFTLKCCVNYFRW